MISVEVVYTLPDRQYKIGLQVEQGCTALQALEQSGLQSQLPGVDLAGLDMGIYSRLLDGRVNPSPADYVMQPGDRLELYRPLQTDPKTARLQRARRKR